MSKRKKIKSRKVKMRTPEGKIKTVSEGDASMYRETFGWKEINPQRKISDFYNKTYPKILDTYSENLYNIPFDELDIEGRENIIEILIAEKGEYDMEKFISLGKESFDKFIERWEIDIMSFEKSNYKNRTYFEMSIKDFYDEFVMSRDSFDEYFYKIKFNVLKTPKEVKKEFNELFPKKWSIKLIGYNDIGEFDEYEIFDHDNNPAFRLFVDSTGYFLHEEDMDDTDYYENMRKIFHYIKTNTKYLFNIDNHSKRKNLKLNLNVIGFGWEGLYDVVQKGFEKCRKKESPYMIMTKYAKKKFKDRVTIRCGWEESTHIEGGTGTVMGLTQGQVDLLSNHSRDPWLILEIGRKYPGDKEAEMIAKKGGY